MWPVSRPDFCRHTTASEIPHSTRAHGYDVGVYLRETRRRNKDGSVVAYLQLAHNERHPESGVSTAKVIHNFGRADQIDKVALTRLVASIARVLDPTDAAVATAGSAEIEVLDSRPMGASYVLDALWERLGIGRVIRELVSERRRRLDAGLVERVIFAMVANRAIEPLSKLAGATWVTERVYIPGLPEVSDDACYRAMDFFLKTLPELTREVFFSVADLLSLDVDLVFFDTTSTYFETEATDVLRKRGHSKDHRDDLLTELREEPSQFRAVTVGWPPTVLAHARRPRIPGSRLVDGAVGGVVGRDRRPLRALSAA